MSIFDKSLKEAQWIGAFSRVSTAQQKKKGAGELQQKLLKKRLDDKGVPNRKVTYFIEEGISAQLPREDRPVYNQMLHEAVRQSKRGKKAIIVVTELDRFTRNQFEAGRDMSELLIPNNIKVMSFNESIVTGTDDELNIDGNLLFGIMSSLATAEGGKAKKRGKESREKLDILGFSDSGAKLSLYSESDIGNLYREALEIEDMVMSGELTPTGASKNISRKAGFKSDGSTLVISPKVFFRPPQKSGRLSPYLRMKDIQEKKGDKFLEEWLSLLDRLIEYEKTLAGTPQMGALRYQTSGAIGLNPNAPKPSFWTHVQLQKVVDNFESYLSESAKTTRKLKRTKKRRGK